jgi:GNAT superfamily N-acetyltransferase
MLENVSPIELEPDSPFYLPAVRLVHDTLFPDSSNPPSHHALTRYLTASTDSIGLIEDGELTGLCLLDLDKPRSELVYLGITPSMQGLGKGGEFIRECESIVKEFGARTIWLYARKDARDFYYRHGYKPDSSRINVVTKDL